MFQRRASRTATLGIVLGMLTAACVDAEDPGVDVQSLQADVVFGVELIGTDAPVVPPAVVPTPAPNAPAPPLSDGTLRVPFRNSAAARLPTFDLAPPPELDCPPAGLGASPDLAAPEVVETMPREGLYTWRRHVVNTLDVEGVELRTETSGSEFRLVQNLTELGGSTDPTSEGVQFSYEVVRPGLRGETITETWRVNTAPVSAGVNPPRGLSPQGVIEAGEGAAAQQGVDADFPDEVEDELPTGNRVHVGEPNRGLVFAGEVYTDGNGAQIGGYNPSPALLVLPLDVQAGDFWTSTGVDPRTGETRRLDGIVAERRSVDACGELLDGWLVQLDEIRAVEGVTVTQTTEFVVSTQFGAVVIGETSTQEAPGSTVEADFRVGQRDPSPIPEELRQ